MNHLTIKQLMEEIYKYESDYEVQVTSDGLGGGYINIIERLGTNTYKIIKSIEVKGR